MEIIKEKKKKTVFVEGAITPDFIASSIAQHTTKTTIGAHDIFLGQVRKDEINGKFIKAIDYSTQREMAELEFHKIREAAFQKYDLCCMHIYHSLGKVNVGEICLFVFVSSAHRNDAFNACREIVEQIKWNVPVWGKEIFEDETYQWKENLLNTVSYTSALVSDMEQIRHLAQKWKLDVENFISDDFITARLNGEIIGFGRIKKHTDFDEISTLGVVEPYRNKSIGKKLIDHLLEKSGRKVYLATVIPNYFTHYGFEICQEIPSSLKEKINQCHSNCNCEKVFVLTKES